MRLSDVITVNRFPAVIAGSDVSDFRSRPSSPEAIDFLSGYLGFDARSQHALHTSLSSLTKSSSGGAFWLNGVFGSGKSHLLGLITLLAEGRGHEVFASSHPDCAAYLFEFQTRLAVHISLDEYDASRIGLEDIFWQQVKREVEHRGLQTFEVERSGSRVESFAVLEQFLRLNGLSGIVVCLDELSLFLSSRAHDALQADAAFLQFLGGHTRRAPIWVFAALQKTIDDISGLESYSLSQIRDRFTVLPLSLTNIPALVNKRLITVKDEHEVNSVCTSTWGRYGEPAAKFGIWPN